MSSSKKRNQDDPASENTMSGSKKRKHDDSVPETKESRKAGRSLQRLRGEITVNEVRRDTRRGIRDVLVGLTNWTRKTLATR